jgi:acyl-CoA reductase-like NAD-dependent aldehyde dehydrogenase
LCDEIIEDTPERQVVIRQVPLGVAVGIVPWNFPTQLAIGKHAQSVLDRCPIIIKPSPFPPYCGLKLVELAYREFPAGVAQALSGDDSSGP